MKSAISPDIWENKRMLITKLYKDEEWPLKQVIKLVQTNDFHPSESQLRSRLKKWHITKPSRKKYDGSRRLSGAKKNAMASQKRQLESQSSLPPSATYNTLQSHPLQHGEESDEARSETSRTSVSIPEMSTSPTGQYILPSSPIHDEALYGPNPAMAPPSPITPAFYGMDEPKRASDAGHPIYFCPPDVHSEYPVPNSIQALYAQHGHFGSFSGPSPLMGDSLGYQGVPYMSPHTKQQQHPDGPFVLADLPPPLLDGSQIAPWAYDYHQPPSPTSVYPHVHPHSHSHPYFHETPIYQIM
ncbi:hypothetical protein BJX68DRAFT_154810 [Aspergillus pseudodeflectus]|uniref:Clr5 domain-containing protein n=1 Tax=Aspergillus pseudodeflectus TaxID=176178 RepID=A0ABR4JU47_9EURO